MSGQVGDLSEKQAAALGQFKESIQDLLKEKPCDDYYLLRWLRARNFDVKAAETMLRNDAEWRKRICADTILDDFKVPEVIQKYYTGGWFGVDKTGCPLWFDPFGNIDMKGMHKSAKKLDLIKNKVYLLEWIYKFFIEESKRTGKRIDQVLIIFDIENIGVKHLWKPGVDLFIEMMCMFEDHYPETLRHCFIINAPYLFPVMYNVVKPFLSEDTKRKVQVVSGDYRSTLLQYIDAEQLPEHYGGTCKIDGDPKCSAKICYGGIVPKSYYRNSLDEILTEDYTETVIQRGDSLKLVYEIKVPKTEIIWNFATENSDIGFGIFKKKESKNTEVIVQSHKVQSHLSPEEGRISCDTPGTYVLHFDNTYSWIKSKRILYLIQIMEPNSTTYSSDND